MLCGAYWAQLYFGIKAGWTGEDPARSHKPFDAGSNPAPAIEVMGLKGDGKKMVTN